MNQKPIVAISACLRGEAVRYDGGHKRLSRLERLQQYLELLSVCPEQEAGLGTPRPPVQLVLDERGLRARGRDDPSLDVTDALTAHREQRHHELLSIPLCGYVFKSRSPSCALHSAPVFSGGTPLFYDNGLFTDHITREMPWLATCDEGALDGEHEIASFVSRCQMVRDVLYQNPAHPLMSLHRLYHEQYDDMDNPSREQLEALAHSGKRHEYLQTLWELQSPAESWLPGAAVTN